MKWILIVLWTFSDHSTNYVKVEEFSTFKECKISGKKMVKENLKFKNVNSEIYCARVVK